MLPAEHTFREGREGKRKGKGKEGERFKKIRDENSGSRTRREKNATRSKSKMKIQQRILLSEEQCAERSSEAYKTQTNVQWGKSRE